MKLTPLSKLIVGTATGRVTTDRLSESTTRLIVASMAPSSTRVLSACATSSIWRVRACIAGMLCVATVTSTGVAPRTGPSKHPRHTKGTSVLKTLNKPELRSRRCGSRAPPGIAVTHRMLNTRDAEHGPRKLCFFVY